MASDMMVRKQIACARNGVVWFPGAEKKACTGACRSQLPDAKWRRLLLSVLLVYGERGMAKRSLLLPSHRRIVTSTPPFLPGVGFLPRRIKSQCSLGPFFRGRCRPHSFWRHLGPEVGSAGYAGIPSPARGPSGGHGMHLRIDWQPTLPSSWKAIGKCPAVSPQYRFTNTVKYWNRALHPYTMCCDVPHRAKKQVETARDCSGRGPAGYPQGMSERSIRRG